MNVLLVRSNCQYGPIVSTVQFNSIYTNTQTRSNYTPNYRKTQRDKSVSDDNTAILFSSVQVPQMWWHNSVILFNPIQLSLMCWRNALILFNLIQINCH
jgi:hypothetical protein